MAILSKDKAYEWKFSKIGGVTRVNIETGDDIAHLGELDQKMWTVLSCPTKGLEIDEKTLEILDLDHDGKIKGQAVQHTFPFLRRGYHGFGVIHAAALAEGVEAVFYVQLVQQRNSIEAVGDQAFKAGVVPGQ